MKKYSLLLLLAAGCFAGTARAQFVLLNWVRYNNTPSSLTPYVQPTFLSTQGLTNADSTPNFTAVKTFAGSALANTTAPAIMDIEIWPYSPTSVLTTSINRYNAVIDSFRSVNPNSKLGFYGVPPQQRYLWTNINTPAKYNAWMVVNDSLERMASHIDFFFPSAYSRDTITANWQNYIDSNVSVIRRLYSATKPIYVFIDPQYDGSSAGEVNAQFIDTARWKFLLNLVYSQANGAVIWTSNKDSLGNTLSWDPSMPWWRVTKEFMVQKGLAPPFVLDSLKAIYQGTGGQQIHWVTSADTTTLYFTVQSSTDSVNYTTISPVIPSAGSYYTQNSYSYTDTTAAAGKVYYRLARVSADSNINWTTTVTYVPPVSYWSAGTGVTVDLATATNWKEYNGTGRVIAVTPPNGKVTAGSTITIGSVDTWQNNTAVTTIPAGVTLIDSGANGTFSTTNKITAAGTIVYAGASAQHIPAIASFTGNTLTNLVISNPAGVSTTTGSWTLTGSLMLEAGQFNCNNGGGSFLCKGPIIAGGGTLNAAGYFELVGTSVQVVPANVLLNNAIYHLIVNGQVTDTIVGALHIGNSYGINTLGSVIPLNVTDTAQLSGTVNISGFSVKPVTGQQFTLLSAVAVSGAFSGLTLPSGYTGSLSYTSSTVILTINGVTGSAIGTGVQNAAIAPQTIDTASTMVRMDPNPVHMDCLVRAKGIIKRIVIYNAEGRLIKAISNVAATEYDIPVGNLQPGIYFITISGDKFTFTRRIEKI